VYFVVEKSATLWDTRYALEEAVDRRAGFGVWLQSRVVVERRRQVYVDFRVHISREERGFDVKGQQL